MGITGWLLVWLIVNALFVVWRILVTSDAKTHDRLIRNARYRDNQTAQRPLFLDDGSGVYIGPAPGQTPTCDA